MVVPSWSGHLNAGIAEASSVLGGDVDVWDRVVAVNLRGVYLGMRSAGAAIAQSGGGAIVATASVVRAPRWTAPAIRAVTDEVTAVVRASKQRAPAATGELAEASSMWRSPGKQGRKQLSIHCTRDRAERFTRGKRLAAPHVRVQVLRRWPEVLLQQGSPCGLLVDRELVTTARKAELARRLVG